MTSGLGMGLIEIIDAGVIGSTTLRKGASFNSRIWYQVWKSPQDQPSYARPILLSIATLMTTIYAWGIWDNQLRSPYYSAIVYSMSQTWHAFFYGALDPASTISIDKIPIAFQVQSLFVRVLGFHNWVLVLPQVVEGTITILILYRAIRLWSGPLTGLIATVIYGLTPIVAALCRSVQPDTTLLLFLVLAADSWQNAMTTRRPWKLIPCSLWIALAFHAKMITAWAVLPAFLIAYLISAPDPLRRRIRYIAAASVTTLSVSMIWITFVWLTPVMHRPYIDGSTNNSVLGMTFGYNFLSRFSGLNELASSIGSIPWNAEPSTDSAAKFLSLFEPNMASQISWLLPMSCIALIGGFVWRWSTPRTDRIRASLIMWGTWLAIYLVAFAMGSVAHTFYLAALAPAIAALSSFGLMLTGQALLKGKRMAWALPAATAITVAWASYINSSYEEFLPWLSPLAIILGIGASMTCFATNYARTSTAFRNVGFIISASAVFIAPAAWGLSTLVAPYGGDYIGPSAGPTTTFGTGGEPRTKLAQYRKVYPPLIAYLKARQGKAKYALAVSNANNAGPYIMDAHLTVLPLGGFTGTAPYPTVIQLDQMISSKQLRYVLDAGYGEYYGYGEQSNYSREDASSFIMAWVALNCKIVPSQAYGLPVNPKVSPGDKPLEDFVTMRGLYDCAHAEEDSSGPGFAVSTH